MSSLQIIVLTLILSLFVLIPFFYLYKKKLEKNEIQRKLASSRVVTEREKIRVYIDQINQKFRHNRKRI